MTVFLSGGCKNGKSTLAEAAACALAGAGPLFYLATMIPHDEEDLLRIDRHVTARAGKGFATLETPRAEALETVPAGGSCLLDSVTALLANEMFGPAGFDETAPERVAEALETLAGRVENAVFVSDFIQSDGSYDGFTEAYRRGLAAVERRLAARCDTVGEVCAGFVTLYKGAMP